MVLRRIALWPLNRFSGWVDDSPLSAVGAMVAVGALVVLLASVGISIDIGSRTLVYDGVTLTRVTDTVVAQPAYAITVVFGLAVALFYDG